jgi:hypothetical protein
MGPKTPRSAVLSPEEEALVIAFRKHTLLAPIGYFHIDIAEVRTAEGKLHLFVAVDRTSKFAFAQLHEAANSTLRRLS